MENPMAKAPASAKAPVKKSSAKKATVKKTTPKISAAKAAVARYQAPELPVKRGAVPLRPAGGWLRLLARCIDGMVLGLVSIIFGLIAGPFTVAVYGAENTALIDIVHWIILGVVGFAYHGYFLSRYKATPGRMFMQIEVVHAETGQALSFWHAIGRCFADLLNMFTLYLAYLMVFWRRDKRGLHDFIANSRVVRRSEPLPTWRVVLAALIPLFWGIVISAAIVLFAALIFDPDSSDGSDTEYAPQPEAVLPSIPLETGPTE
jgi:uncharacterized RDD family membrane protein YckC